MPPLKDALISGLVVLAVIPAIGSRTFVYAQPPAKSTIAASNEFDAVAKNIKKEVKELGYPDDVGQDFVKMVSGWKCDVWKQRLEKTRGDYKQKKISADQVAQSETEAVNYLYEIIKKEIKIPDSKDELEYFYLPKVIKDKKAQCLGYSQLFYVLGNALGLTVKAVDVRELLIGSLDEGHISCLVNLSDGKAIMVDIANHYLSKSFLFKEDYAESVNYWELKNNNNLSSVYKRIQVYDNNELIASIYNNLGNMYQRKGDYAQSISLLTKAAELNPKCPQPYYIRGVVFSKLNQESKAVEDYTKAIEIDPEYVNPYLNRGKTYCKLNQYEKARSDFTKAIELNPTFADAFFNRAIVSAHLGQHKHAVSDCNKAIELNPENAEAYVVRGGSFCELRLFGMAIPDFDKALQLDSNSAATYYLRGNAYFKLNRRTAAISDYSKTIELDPQNVNAYLSRAIAYEKSGLHAKVISDCAEAIKLDPKNADAYCNRGFAEAYLGKIEEAKKDLQKAVELDPAQKEAVKQISDKFKLGL
jgi:tetratricopeptide (TPR) repeat protein